MIPHSNNGLIDRRGRHASDIGHVDQYVRADASRLICYAVVDAVLEIRERGDVVKPEHVAALVRAVDASPSAVEVCTAGGVVAMVSNACSPVAVS